MLSVNDNSEYKDIYNTFLTSNSPFDYAIPQLNDGILQYPYGETPSQITWNGLLDDWRLNIMKKGTSNTKLIPAFIEPSNTDKAFSSQDLNIFLNEYIITPKKDGGIDVEGVVYLYYSTYYNITLLNENLSKSIDCMKNNKCN